MELILEKKNITLLEGIINKDTGDRNNQPRRGHAFMDNVSNSISLIYYGSSNHMVSCKDSFRSIDSNRLIPIHMGYDSQVSSKGKCTIHIEHGSFKNVLYVPSLASKFISL